MTVRSIHIVLLGALLAGPAAAQDNAEALRKRIAELEAENAKLRQTIAQQAESINALRADRRQDGDVLKAYEAQKQRNEQLEAKLAEVQTQAATLEQEKQQAAQQRQELYVDRDYDAQADRTELSTRALRLTPTHGTRAKHWVTLSLEHAGEAMGDAPTHVVLAMQTIYSGDLYRTTDTITFEADGKAFVCKVSDYERTVRKTGSMKNRRDVSDEAVYATMPTQAVRAIANATKVTGRAGIVRFELPRPTHEGFAAFAEAMEE